MLPGVYTARKKNGSLYYRASITHQNKHISLGSYDTEPDANQAYLQAQQILTSFEITLDSVDTLPGVPHFEKKISLLNFRDNRIYFKNPIYLKQNYFLYYIAPHDELKFDVDDLFYYSSHKIMRRRGHLFVSDYGMQVNILSRYGIKNFAVAGRDYLFVNGDPTDFRYSNLKVINRYYGVSRVLVNNQIRYKARIHLTGNHTLGVYPTEEQAAIAYNKAADLAHSFGISKNFTANYIPELSPREYAGIYTQLELSPKYLEYLKNLEQSG